ncbi:MAG: 1-(5-phosphoribosyl)-5-[Bacteroidaceae bacterium]|nr:1-(5-phosphoribosyl)-5-[(5-phosphoribosylamino)methylideneamino]imidazole-4-carboxamide isomerase [Bacteroidaceae bacterium]
MIEIIPAIDIIEGKCVRLTKGEYSSKKVYNEDPLEVARQFEDNGITRLHMVDLDGAKSSHVVNYNVLERIAGHTNLTIDFGGGIKSDEDVSIAFNSGSHMITVGSIAVKNKPLFVSWIKKFGADRIILGADVKDNKISINGWKEESNDNLVDFLKDYTAEGIERVLCTDISRDGMLKGPATGLYKSIMGEFPEMKLIASGGVSSIDDIDTLDKAGIPSVVFGKAIYEGRITMQELQKYIIR